MKKSWSLVTILCLTLFSILPAFPSYAGNTVAVPAPVIYPGSGTYLLAPSVTITSVSGAVYYTTDSSNPATSRTAIAYNDPFPVNQSETLLAAACTASGWSGVASATFHIGLPAGQPSQTDIASAPVQAAPVDISALYNRNGQAVVSVVYAGALDPNASYNVKISDITTGERTALGTITASAPEALIAPIEVGHTFKISIQQKGNCVQYYGTFSIQNDAHDQEQLNITQQKLFYTDKNGVSSEIGDPSTADATTYSGYHADGSPIFSGFGSLFKAIDTVSTWEKGAYVLENDNGERVFATTNSTTTFYLYQHTAYYGATTQLATANAWISNFADSHVIYGNGRFYENDFASTGSPDYWSLEPQSGGYVYKYSYASSVYQTVYETLNFTQAKLRESTDPSHPYNAYVCLSSQNDSGSAEGGIVSTYNSHGKWYLYYKRTDTPRPIITDCVVCDSTQSGGVYTPNANLELTYSYSNGSFKISVRNLSTNQVFTSGTITDQGVGTPSVLISATSYVPLTRDFTNTPDYQAGGYFKNVIYSQNELSDNQGNTYGFWASGGPTHYTLVYNADYCTLTEGDSSEKVDISYERS
jgi:hypothetical protein